MDDAPKTIITWVTVLRASGGSFTLLVVEWLEKVGDNEQGKNGGEWAALADALFHEEGVPCVISPFVVDGPRLFIEEGGEGDVGTCEGQVPRHSCFFGNRAKRLSSASSFLDSTVTMGAAAYNTLLPFGMVQAWVAHFVTPLKCTYDEYKCRVTSQKPHKKHKQHEKQHHHGVPLNNQ